MTALKVQSIPVLRMGQLIPGKGTSKNRPIWSHCPQYGPNFKSCQSYQILFQLKAPPSHAKFLFPRKLEGPSFPPYENKIIKISSIPEIN